jgi:hypothetical protein
MNAVVPGEAGYPSCLRERLGVAAPAQLTTLGNLDLLALPKPILDEIDTVLAGHYGFTAEELDFIVNNNIKYRLGRGAGEEDE